ncbi:TMV resistance protein N [Rosa chinensis]|nr:TMV resistance protein N [Rosa chinensis]XP_024189901.1 TMV resistance protein N [Rosa chinensis]
MATKRTFPSVFPSSSSSYPPWNYDVFLSFRGEDTRKSFTDHLYFALKREGISTFRDDELERGKPISSELGRAIQESRFALVIFSRNYASSRWCLDELAEIVQCMKEMGQTVLPIFYNVDPSNVRKQTGSFAEAFDAHEERFKDNLENVQRWRAALTEVANLSGFHLQDGHESEFIQKIIEKLGCDLVGELSVVSKDLVGIDCRVEEIMKLCSGIRKENDVGFIGISGMGGIGKTTLAQAFYDKIANQFPSRSFLHNVREVSERDGIVALQEKLLRDVRIKSFTQRWDVHDGISGIKHRLRHKKVLIILDDVDSLEQLQALAGSDDWFGQGSRIIVTTRNEHLLNAHGVDRRYKVKELRNEEALQLFSWKAFKSDYPQRDYMELSLDFVNYAKGLPLALEVLGPFLFGKSIIEWKSAFSRLKQSPEGKIMSVLIIGFDGLHEKEKQIFLDIACFFRGNDKEYVEKILESFGFDPVIGLRVLIDKSLITVVGKILWMHDLVQEMGQEIVRQENTRELGKRSRLWHCDDVLDVLEYNKGTKVVEGLVLKSPQQRKVQLNCETFLMMKNLRLLGIYCDVVLPEGLKYLSTELRVVQWERYPLKLFPSNFPSSKLVELTMCCSNIKQLWKGFKALERLKSIELTDSESLTETPDFTGVPNLERLILEGCTKLSSVHPSIRNLKKLVLVNMRNCKSLESITCKVSMESLETFILSGCSKLKRFPEIVGDMKCLSKICLDGTAIQELPSSIEFLTGLMLLNLSDCKKLLRLPSVIYHLTSLKTINLSGCSNLDEIPLTLGGVESLEELDVSGTAIRQMPSSIVYLKNLKVLSCSGCTGMLSSSLVFGWFPALCPAMGLLSPFSLLGLCFLTELDLSYCNLFDGAIPNDLDCLSSLKYLYLRGNNFTSLPQSISRLSNLWDLCLRDCSKLQSLPKLPITVEYIWTDGCTSLRSDSDQYEVWPSGEEGRLAIIKRSVSPECLVIMPELEFIAVLQRYHDINEVEGNPQLKTTYGVSVEVFIIPGWFTNKSYSSFITIQLPTELYNKSRPWIGYALYVCFRMHDDFDTGCDLKVMHELDCYFETKEGPRRKETLCHELNVKDIPFTGPNGYWLYITHAWFSQRLNGFEECSSIEVFTRTDNTAVQVKMSGSRLLKHEQDVLGFIQAIKSISVVVRRSREFRKVYSVQETKLTMKKQGGESTSGDSDWSRTHLLMSTEDQGCTIDSTVSLEERMESLPLDFYEGQQLGEKTYCIVGIPLNPHTASALKEILQEYSHRYIMHSQSYPQYKLPEWFCSVNGSSVTIPLNSSLGSMRDLKGIAICAAFTIHGDPSLLPYCYVVECHVQASTGLSTTSRKHERTSELIQLKRTSFISITYISRRSILNELMNDCTMKITYSGKSQDLVVRNCGYQLVFHENVGELVETIVQCGTSYHPNYCEENNSIMIL